MATVSPSIQSAVLAVLREARERGLGKLSRTALFKLVYLLDCLHAESHAGQISSGAGWYFHKFGPYAVDLAQAIDTLAARGLIQSAPGEVGDNDYTLYWLNEYPVGPSLVEVGLVGLAHARFGSLMGKLSRDLPKLLDYAYFNTLPMRDATPGKRLEFQVLADERQTLRHEHTHIKDHAKIRRLAELSHNLTQKFSASAGNARAMAAHRSIYDRAFVDAMSAMDGEDRADDPISFDAALA